MYIELHGNQPKLELYHKCDDTDGKMVRYEWFINGELRNVFGSTATLSKNLNRGKQDIKVIAYDDSGDFATQHVTVFGPLKRQVSLKTLYQYQAVSNKFLNIKRDILSRLFMPNNGTFEKLIPESNFATKVSFMAANKAASTC
uniref:Ig-like domain-containing protein n=1 Tax=Escherichia coli TaxID=562 RepID=A0A6D1P0C7_ECOLX|nr:hypothetical protein [Escherichia coli]